MSQNAVSSQTSQFKIGDGGGPETFNAVGDVKRIGGPTGSATVLDASDLDSTAREKKMGLFDEGQISVEGNWTGADTYQDQMRTDRANKTQRNFQIAFANGDIADFAGFVLTFDVAAGVDELLTFASTIEITGAVTWS
ncbi:MAG: phage tail tube protein [Acidobacteriota bacterium]|nr:phage tail tube protein [Acidobacteriota bacterium]